jgi:hypothetical protein
MSVETAILSVHLANFVPNHPCYPRNPRFPCPISKNRRSTIDKGSPIACFSVQLPRRLIGPSPDAKPIEQRSAMLRELGVIAEGAKAQLQRRHVTNIEKTILQRIQPGDVVQNPKRGQHERVINCLRTGPDFLKTERTDHARIPRQMRFIIPNKSGSEYLGIGDENERNENQRPKPVSPPE